MKIRYKFGIGFIIIFSISFIVLNFIINEMRTNFVIDEVKEEMYLAYKSTYRFVNSYAQYNLIDLTKENIIEHIPEIATNISEDKRCELYVLDENNEQLYKYNLANGSINYDIERVSKYSYEDIDNKNLLDIYYEDNNLTAATIFPLYMYKKYVGTIILTKDFTIYYNSINEFIGLVKLVNVIIFIVMIIAVYLFSGKIVNPLVSLRGAFKEVEKGEYDIDININTKDEIGELSKGFSSMKRQIKKQIVTIINEKEKVLALEATRTEFFNNVTHELKTPLTTISGYAQILQQENFNDAEFHDYALERIEKESERMHRMVVALIEVSKNKTDIKKENKALINIKDILEEILKDLSIKALKYKLNINADIEYTILECNEEDIRSVFINIIDNAIKYSKANTTINIKSIEEGNLYKFEVENYSDEISEEGIKNVLKPFYRENIDKSRKLGSNGLGLFICEQIVESYGGSIEFNYDEKVNVTIRIPQNNSSLVTF